MSFSCFVIWGEQGSNGKWKIVSCLSPPFCILPCLLSVKMLNCLCCINKIYLKSMLCECFLTRLIPPFLNTCSTAQFYLRDHIACSHFLPSMRLALQLRHPWEAGPFKNDATQGRRWKGTGIIKFLKDSSLVGSRDDLLGEGEESRRRVSKRRTVMPGRCCQRFCRRFGRWDAALGAWLSSGAPCRDTRSRVVRRCSILPPAWVQAIERRLR